MIGCFFENGPWKPSWNGTDLILENNPFGWNQNTDVLWVDQPIGAGFTYGGPYDFAHTEDALANDFYNFMQEFLIRNSQYKGKDLIVTGESYGGHYVPIIAAKLKSSFHDMNLVGIAIGNGIVSDHDQEATYGQFAHNLTKFNFTTNEPILGTQMIGDYTFRATQISAKKCARYLELNDKRAENVCTIGMSVVLELNPGSNQYDVRKKCEGSLCYNMTAMNDILNLEETQIELNVIKRGQNRRQWNDCNNVHMNPYDLSYVDMKQQVSQLLDNHVFVLVYSGEYDLSCNWRGGEAWTHNVFWEGKDEFKKLDYIEYKPQGLSHSIGQIKYYRNLQFLKVYNSGHMVPLDQPKNAVAMINQFIEDCERNKLQSI